MGRVFLHDAGGEIPIWNRLLLVDLDNSSASEHTSRGRIPPPHVTVLPCLPRYDKMAKLTEITELIEKLSQVIHDSHDDDLMYHHISLLRSLATRMQHRLERNDIRNDVRRFNYNINKIE